MEKYRPSNGSEGQIFEHGWCAICLRDRPAREDTDGLDGCSILANVMLFEIDHPNYPKEWVIEDAEAKCTAFELDKDELKTRKLRSLQQNRSLHRYCSLISEGLNDAGFTQRSLWEAVSDGFEIDTTMRNVKDIFRQVGFDMYGVESTSKLSTVQIQEVHKNVDRAFSLSTGVHVEWPSKQGQADEAMGRKK